MTTFEALDPRNENDLNFLRAIRYGLAAQNGSATSESHELRLQLDIFLAQDDRGTFEVDRQPTEVEAIIVAGIQHAATVNADPLYGVDLQDALRMAKMSRIQE